MKYVETHGLKMSAFQLGTVQLGMEYGLGERNKPSEERGFQILDRAMELGVNTLDTGDLLIFCAVCEQALFLALNEAGRPTRSSRHGALKSETIDGVGKREYYDTVPEKVTGTVSTHTGQLAPRSELFLSRLPGYGRSTGRLSRG